MKSRLKFLLWYYLFWLALFAIGKIVFLLYQYNQSFELDFLDWLGIFWHGFRLDLSTSGYIILFPALVLSFTSWTKSRIPFHAIDAYTALMLIVFILITLVDMEIYKYWGTRLDVAPLRFLSTPGDTLASSTLLTLFLYFSSFIVFPLLLFRIYLRLLSGPLKKAEKTGFWGHLLFMCITCAMILPIRGGFGVTAINTGSAYFHKNTFVNQAAVNVVWNFGKSVAENKVTENPYLFYKDLDYAAGLHELYRSGDSSARVLRVARPNIVLLVLESFSAKVIEPLGGTKGITPEFNNWCSHGVLFSNIYASDSRTDKGLAAVLSGYPVLEAIPILAYPEKTRNMPFLSKSLGSAGYHASFTYGGDVEFANMKSYLVNGNFNSIVTDSDFPSTLRTGKWGVPDHHVYNYFLEECKADTGRWFKVMMSLSNHEPFEIPGTPKYGNKNLAERYYSSAFYADSCLGDFISRFKASGLWDNTLIIMVADHGTRLPDYSQVFEPRKFHIPMLWIGGALNQDTVVSKTGSQADLAVTLLEQLGLPDEEYVLGKNLLSASSKSFAFYSYKNGIAMITDSGGFGLDFTANHFNFSYGEVTDEQVHYAKTLQQLVFDNYLKLSQSPVPN